MHDTPSWNGWDFEELWQICGGEPTQEELDLINTQVKPAISAAQKKLPFCIPHWDARTYILRNRLRKLLGAHNDFRSSVEDIKRAEECVQHLKNFLLTLADQDDKMGETDSAKLWRLIATFEYHAFVRYTMAYLEYMWN